MAPLHWAATEGRLRASAWLLGPGGADPEARDKQVGCWDNSFGDGGGGGDSVVVVVVVVVAVVFTSNRYFYTSTSNTQASVPFCSRYVETYKCWGHR